MLRNTIAMTFSAVSVLALAACGSNAAAPAAPGSAAAPSQQAAATSAPAAAPTSVAPAAAPSDSLSAALAAIATAEKAVGGIAVSIDDEDDDKSWEVDVQTDSRRVEVKVSGDGATVLKQDNEDHEADEWAAVSGAKVRIADAMKAAIAHTPGRFDDADLDDDNDRRHHWEVSVYPEGSNDSIDLDVDLGTGQVSKR